MSKKIVEKSSKGIVIKQDAVEKAADKAKKDAAKNKTAKPEERIEAKLDLLLNHFGIKL